jgi:hypothetical protein
MKKKDDNKMPAHFDMTGGERGKFFGKFKYVNKGVEEVSKKPVKKPRRNPDDERAALIEYFENLEPRTEAVGRLKTLRLAALKAGQEVLDYEGIQRALGRESGEGAGG